MAGGDDSREEGDGRDADDGGDGSSGAAGFNIGFRRWGMNDDSVHVGFDVIGGRIDG